MTTSQHKQNPFGLLDNTDSEEEDSTKTSKPKKVSHAGNHVNPNPKGTSQAKPKAETVQTKQTEAPKASAKVNVSTPTIGDVKDQAPKEKTAITKAKEPRKQKGVPADPHPLDRHSGTGISAFEKKPKKSGAGKYNVGTVKDEIKEAEPQTETANEEVVEPEAEKDAGMTLEEYYKKNGITQEERQQQINESKAKVTQQELLKEIGTAKPLDVRSKNKVDDVNQKKKTQAEHAVAINTEFANLLGFKTGFKTFTEKKPLDQQGGNKPAPQGDKKPEDGTSPQIKPEGQQVPVEGQEAIPEQPQSQDKPVGGKGPRQYNNEGGPRKYNPNWKGPRQGEQRNERNDRPERTDRTDRRGGDNRVIILP